MTDFPHSALEEYKTQASILLKHLRSDDTATRLECCSAFSGIAAMVDSSLRLKLSNRIGR